MEKRNPGYYTDLADRLRAVESRSKDLLLKEAARAADTLAELCSGPHCGNCMDRRTCLYHSCTRLTPTGTGMKGDGVLVIRFNCILHRRDEDA